MKKEETDDFQPFIPADKIVPEFTVTSIVLGVLLAVVFGAANAYLGLRVGMTISASIPAAVISMGIIRMVLRKDSILENNMVQTIGSAGESIAAGAIFTLPAMFIWMQEWGEGTPSLLEITLIALVGGILGILFMIPLRKALIVEEHAVLPYPEGTACAEVLLAGEEGGSKASAVFTGLGAAAGYKLISDGFKLFPSSLNYDITAYKGSAVGIDLLPALVGVGYICGPRISSYMLAGGVMSWLVMMPMLSMFGGDQIFFPATDPVSALSPSGLWSNYIRYIGAGAVAAGGIISLVKSFPLIIKTFGNERTVSKRRSGGCRASHRTGYIDEDYSTGSDCYHTADMGTAGFSRSVGRRFHHCGIRFLFCNGICKTGRTGGKQQQSGVWYDHCNSVVFHLVVKTDWHDRAYRNAGCNRHRLYHLYGSIYCRGHFSGSENRISFRRNSAKTAIW